MTLRFNRGQTFSDGEPARPAVLFRILLALCSGEDLCVNLSVYIFEKNVGTDTLVIPNMLPFQGGALHDYVKMLHMDPS